MEMRKNVNVYGCYECWKEKGKCGSCAENLEEELEQIGFGV